MNTNLSELVSAIQSRVNFSGSVFVEDKDKVLVNINFGYANRSDQLENNSTTRFGIASGCKLFTAIAICQLVEAEKISFDSKLSDFRNIDFKNFDDKVTVHHLLSHTSGIPDYFDEDIMDDFEELWVNNPMYQIRNLKDFLPMFQNNPMKSEIGNRFTIIMLDIFY